MLSKLVQNTFKILRNILVRNDEYILKIVRKRRSHINKTFAKSFIFFTQPSRITLTSVCGAYSGDEQCRCPVSTVVNNFFSAIGAARWGGP